MNDAGTAIKSVCGGGGGVEGWGDGTGGGEVIGRTVGWPAQLVEHQTCKYGSSRVPVLHQAHFSLLSLLR